MIIKFTNHISINIDNVPENFDEMILESFKDFTRGTNPKCMFIDKLLFIDHIRRYVNTGEHLSSWEAVLDVMHEKFDELIEADELPDEDTFTSKEFMVECYEAGNLPLATRVTGKSYVYEKIQQLIVRAIKVVINYEADNQE